ncbi:hypothetical protein DXG01_003120 [Tephrocybe rancida]|nr:hypothetical protein DXG01_003120 [Tephrocybe rancida]
MAASAADVRSILSIPEPSATPGPSQPKKQPSASTRKPDGISRELYALIGPSAPSLVAVKPRLKQKPNLGGGTKVKWESRTFKNTGRQDSLELRHWVKASTAEDAEYQYAKYDVPPNVFTYSQDEYTRFLEERELTRKKYILSLEGRTPEQIAEEEALFVEVKRLEQNERKFKKERDELLRTLAGIDSGLPDIVEDEGLSNLTIDTKKRKRGSTVMDIETPSTPVAPAPPVAKRQVNTARNAAFDAANCIIRTDPPTTVPVTKAAHQPAYLRSYKLPTPKSAVAPKVTAALAELGINHNRLVMPTRDNITQLESLLEATTALVETKRVVDKVEYDIRILKGRLGMRESQGAESQPSGDIMDVDEAIDGGEAIGEDGRAQSVVSTRSRKQASVEYWYYDSVLRAVF